MKIFIDGIYRDMTPEEEQEYIELQEPTIQTKLDDKE